MPRASRHDIPGCVWHITHGCHEKKFLLQFTKDRKRWLNWLFEAKKWVEEPLASRTNGRERKWTASIAVGSRHFVEDTKAKVGVKASGRVLEGVNGVYDLREPPQFLQRRFWLKKRCAKF